jgi:hypothetical protein
MVRMADLLSIVLATGVFAALFAAVEGLGRV